MTLSFSKQYRKQLRMLVFASVILVCQIRVALSFLPPFTKSPRSFSPMQESATTTPTIDPEAWKELSVKDCQSFLATAEVAARAAGGIITSHVGCGSEVDEECEIKVNLKDIVTEYDKQCQQAIETIIRAKFPEHAFLGEEDVDPGSVTSAAALMEMLNNKDAELLWVCDPIDATANFASGMPLCAVTLGVVYKGTPVVAATYDPFRDEMYTAIRGQGAYLNGERLLVSNTVTSISDAIINAGCPADPNAFEASMRGMLALNGQSRGLRVIACSALTTAWIAAGRLTGHFGYDLSSWDLVAGALLIHEAGGLVTDLDGTPYNIQTRNMLCSNGLVHDQILEVLREADAVSFERSSN